MLTVHHLSKSYNINSILTDINFSINKSDRIGLVGPNGCGKTTLLRILAGIDIPDDGVVTRCPLDLRIGYLAQGFELTHELTIDHFLSNLTASLPEADTELRLAASVLAKDPQNIDLQEEYDQALIKLESIMASNIGHQKRILEELGVASLDRNTSVSQLSGGQKTRLALASVLLNDPQLLLLDEPTNHLDINMLEWLEGWINSFEGAALIVSHDRTFLDNTVTRIFYLNPETQTVRGYSGNYSDFLDQYQQEVDKQRAVYRDQVYEISKMREDITLTKQHAFRVEQTTTSRQPGVRRIAKKVAKKARSRERKLQRFLNSDEIVAKPKDSWQMKLELPTTTHQSRTVFQIDNLTIGYPDGEPLLRDLTLTVQSGARIALTGPNGSGKTTLLRTIAGHLKPKNGQVRLGHSVVLGYMDQEQELLNPEQSPLETIQQFTLLNETDARSYLHYYLFSGDQALIKIQDLSYGERARLSLGALVGQGCNLLLLDEPINHLDIPSRERFEQALQNFTGTVLAVVHDRYFIHKFASELWIIDQHCIQREYLKINA
jgi:ATP-binding cassette subfamily F protein 3